MKTNALIAIAVVFAVVGVLVYGAVVDNGIKKPEKTVENKTLEKECKSYKYNSTLTQKITAAFIEKHKIKKSYKIKKSGINISKLMEVNKTDAKIGKKISAKVNETTNTINVTIKNVRSNSFVDKNCE